MRFKNKVAVIASSGGSVGLACARLLCQEGAKVAFLGTESKDLAVLPTEESVLPLSVRCFSDEEEIAELSRQVLEQFGKVDVLVTVLSCPAPEENWNQMPESTVWNVLNQILTGNWITVKYFLPPMIAQESGRIVIITNLAGRTGLPGANPITTAAYAGLGGIIRDVATVYGQHAITANGIAIGPIEGQYFEPEATPHAASILNQKGTGEDVAYAMMYLADQYGAWNTGEIIDLNGGCFAV